MTEETTITTTSKSEVRSQPKKQNLDFRSLSKDAKYEMVRNFIQQHKRPPTTNDKPEDERILGQFWINAKANAKKSDAKQWEIDIINDIMTSTPNRNNKMSKIDMILDFCIINKKTPSQSSSNDDERKLGQLLNTLRISAKNGDFSLEEAEHFKKLHQYRSNYQKSRAEKLTDIIAFCELNEFTPRQHVKDNEDEKRMAELLSTTKALNAKGSLDEECKVLLERILSFAPISRSEKLDILLKFVVDNGHAPKINSNDSDERQLSAFMTKMKSFMKANKLNADDSATMMKIINQGNVKSRLDKINDLLAYAQRIGKIPKTNSDSEEERKFAMFFTNIKQCRKLDKLNDIELNVLSEVEAVAKSIELAPI